MIQNENNKLHLLLWSRKTSQAIGVTITLRSNKEPTGKFWQKFGQKEMITHSSTKLYTGVAVKLQDMKFQEFLSA
jgi:hypothetical protein